jgi:hypothetical protein
VLKGKLEDSTFVGSVIEGITNYGASLVEGIPECSNCVTATAVRYRNAMFKFARNHGTFFCKQEPI